jgi:hypothetical protein
MSTKKTEQTLKKCEQLIERLHELKKTVNSVQSNRKPVSSMGAGWSHDPGTGSYHHSQHGIISTTPHPSGGFEVRHGGSSFKAPTIGAAGAYIRNRVKNLSGSDTGAHNVDPMKVGKGDLDKSGYGPKGGGQYTPADNAKRKSGNVGTETVGNQSVKAYSKNPMAHKVPKGAAGPVKQYTPEQIAAVNEANKLKKNAEGSPWASHPGVPNADREVEKLHKANPVNKAEDIMSNQLANMMAGKAMLGVKPPAQPTDQEMFGHLVPTEEAIEKAEAKWNNTFNWLQEAQKPISSRFSSPEEEEQYWNSIKVNDRDDGKPGY